MVFVPFQSKPIICATSLFPSSKPPSQPQITTIKPQQIQRSKMMHMTFYWGTKLTLLFDWWKTESWPSYYLTLLVCFLFASFFQYLEDQRLRLLALSKSNQSQPSNNSNNITTPFLRNRVGVGSRWTNPVRVGLAVLFGVNSGIGYLLMLAVMSYNGGVLIAVVLGMSVGYFVFRAKEYEALVDDQSCSC